MTWYFVVLAWIVLTTAFYSVGVWAFQMQHRHFPLQWYEVAYIMLASVLIWWLAVSAFAYTVPINQ